MQLYNFDKISHSFGKTEADDKPIKEKPKSKTKGTQTDYRESEAQTDPWEPPLRIPPGVNPEILTLTDLRWNDGLPVGKYEVEKIKRMRRKRAWQTLLSPVDCTNKKTQEFIICLIDQEEWAFRDKELQRIADWKLDATKDLLESVNHARELRLAERFDKVGKCLSEIREKRIEDIKNEFHRNIRKLTGKYRDKATTVPLDPKKCFSASKVESYMKFRLEDDTLKSGEDSEEIPTKESPEDDRTSNLLSTYLSNNPLKVKKIRPRKPDELCIRETRWTDDQLRKLHEDLKNIRLNVALKPNHISRKHKTRPLPLIKI
ncbi:cilia- and flagella-associated protein 91-like [Diachasma alloeum]|uniref:cilia- and flagella-associated protein 91-like n=1 Tax=Diachasma alloeum TaxID=454923 RepID=UPI0007382794|nr:cilia- and flagella-associated protein 91-like [Diachasma alloeum]